MVLRGVWLVHWYFVRQMLAEVWAAHGFVQARYVAVQDFAPSLEEEQGPV